MSVPVKVPSDEVRDYIAEYIRRGGRPGELSRAALVGTSTIDDIRRGRFAYVRRDTAERILDVPLPPTHIGLVRRFQALARHGYRCPDIAALAGVKDKEVSDAVYHGMVYFARIAIAVARAFDTVPLDRRGPSVRTAAYAQNKGWAPIGAWIGVDIDDPDAQPDYGDEVDGGIDEVMVERIMAGELKVDTQHNKRNKAAKDEAIRRFGTRISAEWIAKRVGCTERTVWRVRAEAAGVTMPIHPITPWEDLVPIAKTVAAQLGPHLTRRALIKRLKAIGHGCGDERLTKLMEILRAERQEAAA